VPLNSRSRTLGIITLFSAEPASFSPEIMQLLACIGHQLGVAVENARYHQSVEQIAILEERTRISRELHDSLAQTLGWLSIKTEILEEDLHLGEIEKSAADMKAIRRVVRDACYDVRESIDGLRSRPTGDLTVTAAAWISEFRQRSGLITDFRAMDGGMRLSPIIETELLRILQEALTNVRKHAQAKRVQIDLHIKGSCAELVIEDDGRGFEYMADQDAGHFGLRIMRERAERLGGSFQIDTTREEGTHITVLLPLHPTIRIEEGV
jgi:two-component system nitrate/nitrite sensor histidine kinase NarX